MKEKACKRVSVIFVLFYMQETTQYLTWKGTYRAKNTVKSYTPWVVRFQQSTKKGIEEINFTDISQFVESIKTKYSPKTQEYAMTIVKDYVGYWAKRKPLKIILDDVKVAKARSHSHKPVTPEEYIAMMTWCYPTSLSNLRDLCLMRMLYDTGARISEVCAISREDIDLDTRSAHIENAKRKDDGFLYWGADTNEFLKTYLEQNPDPIFPCIRTCQRIIQKYAYLAKIPKHITCHSFRHSKAWRVLDNGGSVKDVQSILRHKSPLSSFRYLDWHNAKNREQAQKFLDS